MIWPRHDRKVILNIMTSIHQGQPVLSAGTRLEDAKAALIMIHGRGASAQHILALGQELEMTDYVAVAPQAANNTWYPYSFLEPVAKNEPYLSSALEQVGAVVETVVEAGIPREKIILLGFSQGACLTLEFTARNPNRYGGVVALSGGLIGNGDSLRDYSGTLENTPVFIGCSDVDFHIPVSRVHDSAEKLSLLNADVEKRIYPNMGHTINDDEIAYIRTLMAQVKNLDA